MKKNSGEYPIIGGNTYTNPNILAENYSRPSTELTRSTYEEERDQLENLQKFQEKHRDEATAAFEALKQTVLLGGNVFAELMNTIRVASLGQITKALYEVGGKYRRNM
jgi:methylmalonyl-CoA mutase